MAQQGNNNGGGQYTGEDGYNLPPMFSYDPAILAELRALERRFTDAKQDSHTTIKRGRQDFRTAMSDLAIDLRRGKKDIRRGRDRGLRDIGYQREDTRTSYARGTEDLGMRLDDLVRSFAAQGSAQTQAANAAGVLSGGGTAAASAQAREANLAYSRKPIDVERERLGEDFNRDLARLQGAETDIRQDSRTGFRRLRQDVRHDRQLGRRDFRRLKVDTRRDIQRKEREYEIGSLDLVQQAIFNARQNNPGQFSKTGGRM